MSVNTFLVYYFWSKTSARIPFPADLANNQTWQPVNTEKTGYVFSAYMVEGEARLVVLGALSEAKVRYNCLLWYMKDDSRSWKSIRTGTIATVSPEGHGTRYTATVFECPVETLTPRYVSIVSDFGKPTNLVKLQSRPKAERYMRKFTVCLTPIHFDYSRAYELIEWVELNRILGAEKFIVYNYSIASNVEQVLDYYVRQDAVEVVQWRLPMAVDTYPNSGVAPEIHYFAQSVALHDCLFRNKGESEYVVNIDLDEFIVPKDSGIKTWSELIQTVRVDSAKVYVFRSSFFRKDWEQYYSSGEQSVVAQAKKYGISTLQYFNREKRVFVKGSRSKYIAKTDAVNTLMIHFVPMIPLKYDVTVSEDLAILHHYRSLHEGDGQLADSVKDLTILQQYGKELVENVKRVWNDLPQVDMNINDKV